MWSRSAKKTGNAKVQTSVDEFKAEGVILTQADNDRINEDSKIHRLLQDGPDGKPMIQVFEDFYPVFEVMETLVREDVMIGKNPEDVKKVDGDDPFDMLKYLLTNMNHKPKDESGKANKHGRGRERTIESHRGRNRKDACSAGYPAHVLWPSQ